MLAGNLWKQLFQPGESGDLDELRRSTIFEIAAVIFAAVWFMLIGAYGNPAGLIVPFILMASSLGSIWLRQMDLRLVVAWLVATLIAAIACQKLLFPAGPAQYAFPVVVVVSSLLVSGINIFVVAAASCSALLVVARWQGADWLGSEQVITPVLLTLLTACAAWIGSRQMHLALDWMSHSYTRASEALDQLRDERASLARTLKMLEDAYVRIEKMNYALIEARSVAENARQLKAEFAANISHELRTPLNLIIGFSETMANAPETYAGVTWSPSLRGDIEQIYQSSRHLSSLIDDILDLSALDARRLGLTLQDASMEDVIAEAVAMMQDLFRAKNLYLDVKAEHRLPRVRIDVTRIRQVLINLLTNASRFTLTGGVTIHAGCKGDEIEIAVQDTGIGIAPQHIPKVFEEFGQVDGSTTRKHEGTGLGVPLSKRLVESQGGHMWLASERGRGTTFYFTLPVWSAVNVRSPVGPGASGVSLPTSRRVVLVYEPDPMLLRTIRRHLGGYDVIEIGAAEDIVTLCERHQPVALLMNAQEATHPTGQVPDDLPVIKVAMLGNLRAAQSLGVEDYLIKPVLREQLLDSIARLGHAVRNVLIADDDPELVELIARMLQSAGETYRPIRAFGGAEALARLQNERPDLILLDLFMPEVDGLKVLQVLKSDPLLSEIPVIVISAQHPQVAVPQGGLFIEIDRKTNASTTETLNYLQALIGALPLRGLPARAGAPA
ncbi:MAG TPA: ATP-binding protein [Anaerolineae bacterium]